MRLIEHTKRNGSLYPRVPIRESLLDALFRLSEEMVSAKGDRGLADAFLAF